MIVYLSKRECFCEKAFAKMLEKNENFLGIPRRPIIDENTVEKNKITSQQKAGEWKIYNTRGTSLPLNIPG